MFLVENGVVTPQFSAFPENRDEVLKNMDENWEKTKIRQQLNQEDDINQ